MCVEEARRSSAQARQLDLHLTVPGNRSICACARASLKEVRRSFVIDRDGHRRVGDSRGETAGQLRRPVPAPSFRLSALSSLSPAPPRALSLFPLPAPSPLPPACPVPSPSVHDERPLFPIVARAAAGGLCVWRSRAAAPGKYIIHHFFPTQGPNPASSLAGDVTGVNKPVNHVGRDPMITSDMVTSSSDTDTDPGVRAVRACRVRVSMKVARRLFFIDGDGL